MRRCDHETMSTAMLAALWSCTTHCISGRNFWVWKVKPMRKCFKSAFVLMASRGRLRWLQKEVNRMQSTNQDIAVVTSTYIIQSVGCTAAQWCFRLNANVSMLICSQMHLQKFFFCILWFIKISSCLTHFYFLVCVVSSINRWPKQLIYGVIQCAASVGIRFSGWENVVPKERAVWRQGKALKML